MRKTKLLTGAALNGRGSAEARSANDYYPTPPECTVALLQILELPYMSLIWEPACGKGDISKVLKENDHLVVSSDLIDYGYGDTAVDYLTENPPALIDAIITNPPFNGSEEFIKKAVTEAPIVAFLLKSQYWHAKSRLSLFRKHTPKYILPLTWRPQFMPGRGKSPVMEMAWTVWDSSYKGQCMYLPIEKSL